MSWKNRNGGYLPNFQLSSHLPVTLSANVNVRTVGSAGRRSSFLQCVYLTSSIYTPKITTTFTESRPSLYFVTVSPFHQKGTPVNLRSGFDVTVRQGHFSSTQRDYRLASGTPGRRRGEEERDERLGPQKRPVSSSYPVCYPPKSFPLQTHPFVPTVKSDSQSHNRKNRTPTPGTVPGWEKMGLKWTEDKDSYKV